MSALRNFRWVEPNGLAGCAYPRSDAELAELADRGISLVINLSEGPHDGKALARCGLLELNLPVPDYQPPTPEQLAEGVAAIQRALSERRRVVVHCGAGIGRTGTMLACWLVRRGLTPLEAIARVGVETHGQAAAVAAFASRAR